MAEAETEDTALKKIVTMAVPNKDAVDPHAYDNHLEFMFRFGRYAERHKDEFEFNLVTIPRVFPALARERIAEFATVERPSDYIMFWDDDMILDLELFEKLYRHNVDVVAPLAFTRLPPYKPVIYNLVEGYDGVERLDYYINNTVMAYPKNQLVECDAVGFGAVLIKTSVLKAMKKPWFMTTSGAGEDIHFCHKARKLGFRVFVDTSVKLGHIGEPVIVTEEVYESQQDVKNLRANHPDEVKYPQAS